MQGVVKRPWIPAFNIEYLLGVDGISMPLVVLTTFLSVLACAASWPITKHVKAYHVLFLLLETGMLGVFVSLDFFLFYVFWEVMLLPMYFLIGIWGGPRREYAAIKFFLYTLLGSVLMLLAPAPAVAAKPRWRGTIALCVRVAASAPVAFSSVAPHFRPAAWILCCKKLIL